jgi:DNA-binding XRE family transcriptional regulator
MPRYSEEDAEQILKLAARKASASSGMDREELLAAASELGLSRQTVLEAEREYHAKKQEEQLRRDFDRHLRAEFLNHLVTYLTVNAFLLFLDLRRDMTLSWAYWPLLGWGIGLVIHAYNTFSRSSADYNHQFEKWKLRKERKARRQIDWDDDDLEDALEDIEEELDLRRDRDRAIAQLSKRTDLTYAEAEDAIDQHLRRQKD